MAGTLNNQTMQIPSHGIFGGYPGSTTPVYLYKDVNVLEKLKTLRKCVATPEQIGGRVEILPTRTDNLFLKVGEVFRVCINGGGGVGDPLLRDPGLVAKDVREGLVSVSVAKNCYGVVINPKTFEVDRAAIKKLRQEIREKRIGRKVIRTEAKKVDQGTINLYLTVEISKGEETIVCNQCRSQLCLNNEDWKKFASTREETLKDFLTECEYVVDGDPPLVIKRYFCPSCAVMLDADYYIPEEQF
jgi:N-methylhydantoinase B